MLYIVETNRPAKKSHKDKFHDLGNRQLAIFALIVCLRFEKIWETWNYTQYITDQNFKTDGLIGKQMNPIHVIEWLEIYKSRNPFN